MPNASSDRHKEAEVHLAKKDPVMRELIRRYGPCVITPHTRYFSSLCSAIISQQLSVKVAARIEERFNALFRAKNPTPQQVLNQPLSELRSVGLSERKAQYMQSLAEHFVDGRINTRRLQRLSDAEVIEALTEVHGIGKWTAEMFLIFTLGRPDVFSVGDYGLRTASAKLYNLATPAEIEAHATRWSPYRSVASWYLWRSLENYE